jgi:hypothetical protein
MINSITWRDINQATGGRNGCFDLACPLCGPERRSSANRIRKVLRILRIDDGFATFHCARCGEKGHVRDRLAPPPNPIRVEAARQEAKARERAAAIKRLGIARWLWTRRQPLIGTAAERYLRDTRGYGGPIPATLGFLPALREHSAAMIATFGFPAELEPGRLAIALNDVMGVHITKLKADGSGKAGTDRDKIMIGRSLGSPIVLAPANDLLGMTIAEGIEDALSAYEATGLGAWAAGSASRMPAIAGAVPRWIDCVSIVADDDANGRRQAVELARRLAAGGIGTSITLPGIWTAAA